MLPLVIDLYCGRGGWAAGFLAEGFHVRGYDIEDFSKWYPGEFVQRDVRELRTADVAGASLIVASPPCTEFAKWDKPCWWSREDLPVPDLSLVATAYAIAKRARLPLILENVRGAQTFLGAARAHFGSFYLWGDVPALLPWVDGDGEKRTYKVKLPAARAVIPIRLARAIAQFSK